MAKRSVITLRAYEPGDIWRFEPRADFARERAAMVPTLADGPPPGLTWTVLRGQEIVGVAGAVNNGKPGCWYVWCMLIDLPRRDWPAALGQARRTLAHLERGARVVEIQAAALAGNPAAERTLRRLGFEEAYASHVEAVGLDYMIMRKVF